MRRPGPARGWRGPSVRSRRAFDCTLALRLRAGFGGCALNTFDRHLLREWLTVLGLVLVLMCGLLLVQVMFDKFRDLREEGARGLDLWKYFMVAIPSYLSVALPLVLLVSTLFVLGKLHRANELTAMRAAGIGFGRLMAPIWVVGLLCCGLSWWLNATVVPWSLAESTALANRFEFRNEARLLSADRIGAVYSVAFANADARRMWFINRYSQLPPARAYGVTVSEMDVRGRESERIVASQAWFEPSRRDWVFKNGREMVFNADSGSQMSSAPFAEKRFERLHENPDLMLLIDRKPIDLSFQDLGRLVDYYADQRSPKGIPYAVRFYGLIADTFGPLIVIAIAIPFAVSGVRVNPAVGVSKSIGLFFLYYLFSNVAASLAIKQWIDPSIAAWLPNVGMTAIAAWFFARLR